MLSKTPLEHIIACQVDVHASSMTVYLATAVGGVSFFFARKHIIPARFRNVEPPVELHLETEAKQEFFSLYILGGKEKNLLPIAIWKIPDFSETEKDPYAYVLMMHYSDTIRSGGDIWGGVYLAQE